MSLRRRALSALGGLAVGALLGGGLLGAGAAVGAALAVDRALRRAAPDADRARARAVERDLPAVCELLAVCLAAGVPVAGALTAVAGATAEPLAGELRTVAALHRLGAPPARAWAEASSELSALGRIVVRAEESGASAGAALHALAVDRRAADRARTESEIRRAGVWVLAPLAGCFLPAFVCLGVAPLVLGIANQVFH